MAILFDDSIAFLAARAPAQSTTHFRAIRRVRRAAVMRVERKVGP
jgi:hypothetical protein